MPGGDRTGPWGAGPMTGRAAGICAGYDTPGYMNPAFGRGYGRGGGRGYGRGFGVGGGRGWRHQVLCDRIAGMGPRRPDMLIRPTIRADVKSFLPV